MSNWNKISEVPPPEGKKVLTKIDDGKGPRNEAILIKRGNLWFTGGTNDMYVYYRPTHWKTIY